MNRAWLYALAQFRTGAADRVELISPSLELLPEATTEGRDDLLKLLDLANDKAALSAEIESAANAILSRMGFQPLSLPDWKWIEVLGLTNGQIQKEPYELARFLGRLVPPTVSEFELVSGFLVYVDDIDDAIDVPRSTQAIKKDFADVREKLAARARAQFSDPSKSWVLGIHRFASRSACGPRAFGGWVAS